MTNLEVIQTWFDRVRRNSETNAIHEMFASTAKAKGLGDRPIGGPDEFEGFQRALLGLIEDVHIQIDETFERGNWICVFCTVKAKKIGTTKEVIIPGCTAVVSLGGIVIRQKITDETVTKTRLEVSI